MLTYEEKLERVRRSIRLTYEKAEQIYGRKFDLPTVGFELRGRVAGRAFIHQKHIGLNMMYADRHEEDFFGQTIPHECAHLISYALHGKAGLGHGWFWQQVMKELGLKVKQFHCYDISEEKFKI